MGNVDPATDETIRSAVAELRVELERLLAHLDATTARVERLEAKTAR